METKSPYRFRFSKIWEIFSKLLKKKKFEKNKKKHTFEYSFRFQKFQYSHSDIENLFFRYFRNTDFLSLQKEQIFPFGSPNLKSKI